jgi:transposase
MQPRLLPLHPKTYQALIDRKQQAELDGAPREARRCQAVLLNHDGWSSGEIAAILKAPRSRVSAWLRSFEQEGWPALREGERPGRPPLLDLIDQPRLADLVDSGPTAYGFLSGVWTSPLIARVIEEEFGVHYHPGHVCRLLHQFGFSVQKPRNVMIRADAAAQQRWSRSVYPAIRGVCDRQRAALVFADEASFRQDSTIHRTWARRGQRPAVPATGTRKSLKVFGCVEVYSGRFLYHFGPVFNAQTYLIFLDQVARRYHPRPVHYIHDNASFHLDAQVNHWFQNERHWWRTHALPKYSPELNAAEPLWRHTRLRGTHNRYFAQLSELESTLVRVFRSMQRAPAQLDALLQPFR